MTAMTEPYASLPDPDRDAAFYADVPAKRALAWIVDSILIAALTLVAIPFTAFTALFYLPVLWLAVGLAYRIVTLAGRSATPGMRLLGIEFRTHRGERFGLAEAALHTAIYSVCVSFVIPQIVSIVLMLTTPRGQGLPDLGLSTVALNRAR
jgi:uncharacterized RDD family membrane protein YckC